jgi:hypothetical protein
MDKEKLACEIKLLAARAGIPKGSKPLKKSDVIYKTNIAQTTLNDVRKIIDIIYDEEDKWVGKGLIIFVDGSNEELRKDIGCSILYNAIINQCCGPNMERDGIAKFIDFSYFVTMTSGFSERSEMVSALLKPKFLFLSDVYRDFRNNIVKMHADAIAGLLDTALSTRRNNGKTTIVSFREPLADMVAKGHMDVIFGSNMSKLILLMNNNRSKGYNSPLCCRVSL